MSNLVWLIHMSTLNSLEKIQVPPLGAPQDHE